MNSGIPLGNIEGNGFSTVDYPANGEASDWMLGEWGILAMSPELGTSDKRTEQFFIKDPSVLKETVSKNYPWIKFTMLKLTSQVHFTLENVFEPKRKYYNSTEIVLRLQVSKNDGIFDNRYRNTPEPKSHSNTCHSFVLKVLKEGSKITEIENYDNDFFEKDRDCVF